MTAYGITLFVHSYLRWLVVITSALLCIRSLMAWYSERSWNHADERFHIAVVAIFDLQFTVGLLLYLFLSPLPWLFFADLSKGIKEPTPRFFALEHVIAMLAATAVMHVSRVQSKKIATDHLRHRRVWITMLIALLIIAAAIPWPGSQHGRPLFRGLTAKVEAIEILARNVSNNFLSLNTSRVELT